MRSILLIILLPFSLIQFEQPAKAADGLEIGKHPPQFELTDLAGKIVNPLEPKGSVILLNFWSTLCRPCTEEMPSLNRLYRTFKENNFEVIAVSIDSSKKQVQDFALEKKIGFTILLDTDKEVFFDLYAGPSLPASYLIDRNGVIVEKFSGPRVWESGEIKTMIRKLLEKR